MIISVIHSEKYLAERIRLSVRPGTDTSEAKIIASRI